jgi:hypothetical protein
MTDGYDGRDLVRLTQSRTEIVGAPAAIADAARFFRERGYIKLSSFIEPSLRDALLDAIDRSSFYEKEHKGIGHELCVTPGPVTGVLEFLMNDPDLFHVIAEITGCGPIGCFRGRVYRLAPSAGHYDSWHDDLGESRLIACSINLGREPFEGGELQIRRARSTEILSEVHNPRAGDAVVFKVDPAFEHRVASVRGTMPRTAYAGWFRREPLYRTLLAGILANEPPPDALQD